MGGDPGKTQKPAPPPPTKSPTPPPPSAGSGPGPVRAGSGPTPVRGGSGPDPVRGGSGPSPAGGNTARVLSIPKRLHQMPVPYGGFTLRVDPVQLFPMDSFRRDWTLLDRTIPLAKGVLPVGGVPVTYDAEALLKANAWLGAAYGPGVIDNIEVEISDEEELAHEFADDDPIIGVKPLGFFGPTIGVGPSPRDLVDKALLERKHSATATARVSASAYAGMSGSASVSGGVDVLDTFGGGVTAGLTATAFANARAGAYAYIRCAYDGGTVSVKNLELGADFSLSWHLSVTANAGFYVELKMPDIPVISSLSHEVSSWPVIGWFVPDLTKLKWRKDFTKSWPLLSENGQHTWTKAWDVLADGASPNAKHSLGLESDQPYDFQTVIEELVGRSKPSKDIPAKDDGPDVELKDGAKASAVAHTRQAAKAQVKSARDNIKRERTWNSRELAQVKKRIKKAAAATPKGPQLAAAPPLVIGGGGGGTPDEQYKANLEEREDKLENADVGAQNVDKKIDEVKSAAEDRIEGPARNEAREGFEKLGENADNLGQAVGGYGAKASEFERPVDPAAPATAQSADADKARLEARKALDEVDEKVDEEMIRSDREWHDAVQVMGLAGYAKHLDSYRADIRISCETPLAKLNTEYLDVPRLYSNLDEQAQVYRTIIIADARDIERKFTALRAQLPAQPWDTRYAVLEDGKLQLAPSYRDPKKKIRRTFYPHDYQPTTNTWMENLLAKLGLATMDGKRYWKYTGPRYGRTNQRGDDWWLEDDHNEGPTIDHKHESVARHWNRAGRFEDQEARKLYYNGYGAFDAHLEVLPQAVNSAKGNAEDKIPYEVGVSVSFRGPRSGL